ncbi:hypothetical protein [Sporomusa acidovorans]|uniref:Protein kinase domain-containing protein n=1 Tax=Sporomusa acidovorans (strain ATCC 49682 / DSM 3132 / Mol) TaxID=1123286 RepID=A0ABZ3J6N3_SPOA4|nr:hypothetical protein [Sporomusa acidovorans]OZC18545.1 hypothetical protein SPACI_34120 [Sporomusa acidovorans DSM 3132]SDE38005.1 hypothetical protein SAMN04488499_101281 [Sporomusa acidovorans]
MKKFGKYLNNLPKNEWHDCFLSRRISHIENLGEKLKGLEPLFGTYHLNGVLGRGGFSIVYKLFHKYDKNSISVAKAIVIPDETGLRELYIAMKNDEEVEQYSKIVKKYNTEI